MQSIRIAEFQVADHQVDAAVSAIRAKLIPRMEGAEGFEGGYWLLDETTGEGIAVTLWASPAARSEFGTAMKQAMEAGGLISGTTIRDYPLVATARPHAAKV